LQTPEELADWIALDLVPGLGGESFRRLLASFGEPRNIHAAGHGALAKVVGDALAHGICRSFEAGALEPTLAWLRDERNHIVTLADPEYPQGLLHISDPPPLLYVKGRHELLNRPSIAVVGSRNATPQGANNAEAFSRTLSDAGLCIVSGLALGIDAAAHRGGLQGVSGSIAVIGTGPDIVYPARNHALAHELAESGAIVSEFSLGTPAKPGNFPRRNRIISGLSAGCLVVEGALQSGSLITARLAGEQGKEVFAIPGSIHSPLSKGCHALIKQGAKLVESASDVLEELGGFLVPRQPPAEAMTNGSHPVLGWLGYDPTDIDTMVARSGLTSETVCAMLLELELEGRVASLPGGLYQRIR
jgi:DNA processing protein